MTVFEFDWRDFEFKWHVFDQEWQNDKQMNDVQWSWCVSKRFLSTMEFCAERSEGINDVGEMMKGKFTNILGACFPREKKLCDSICNFFFTILLLIFRPKLFSKQPSCIMALMIAKIFLRANLLIIKHLTEVNIT